MKICHVTNNLPGYHRAWGGAEQGTIRIIKLLAKNKVENMVLATKPLKGVREDFEFYAVPVLQDFLGEKLGTMLKRPFDIISYYYAYKILKKTRPDIVSLYHFGNLGLGIVLAAKKLGIPIVFSAYDFWCLCPLQTLIKKDGSTCRDFHGTECVKCLGEKSVLKKGFFILRKTIFNKLFFKNLDKIIVLANYWAEVFERYGIKKERISIIPLPLKKQRVKKEDIIKDSILYVGWIVPRKGLHILLKAMNSVVKKFPNAHLYVTGGYDPYEMEYKETIERIIKEHNLQKNVSLLGKKPYEEIERLLQKTEIVVVPEQWHIALSTFMNEAMIYGKPVVASRIGGLPEYLKEGKEGLLANPKNSKDFAEKIIWMLKNKKKARVMGKKAASSVAKKLDERTVFNKLNKLYRDLLKQSL